MKRYESYKDSGVEWIGKVPKHWGIGRMKYTGKFENGLIYSANDISDDSGKLVLRSSNIQSCRLNFTDCIYVHHAPDELMVQKGDIIICSRNGSVNLIGKCAYIENDMNATFGAFMLRYRPQIHSKFAFYLFQSVVSYYKGLFSTTTINQLTKEAIGQMKIPLAPDYEQQALAAYLDKRCSEIDKAIATQQKRIALLQELKQSIIAQAVTRGIHPDVPLKESGVEWIGKVPEHWNVMKMNQVCDVITDYVASGSFAALKKNVTYLDSPDFAMLIRTADLSNKNKDIPRVYVSKRSYRFLSNSNLFGGEIILPNVGSVGDVYVVPDDFYDKMTLGPNAVMVKTKYNNLYYYYYFSSIRGRNSLELLGFASVQGKFNKTELRQLKVPVPSIIEQNEIVSYIEGRTKHIDLLVTKVQQRIVLLQELKQSIIIEAITGKIKVC